MTTPATSRCRARSARTCSTRAVDVAGAGLGREPEQPIGRAAERRHDDDRPAPVGALRLNRRLPRGANDGDQPLDRGPIGDRRAAELHDDHDELVPAACISSALSTDAPAAPRIVL